MKKIGSLVDKQNYLIQNILSNSREGSRRKLKKINANSMDIRVGAVKSHRYQPENATEGDTIELPTFGDWKSQINCESVKENKNSAKLHTKEPFRTLNTEEEEKIDRNSDRLKVYEEAKLKMLAETKLHKMYPLHPIDNPMPLMLAQGEKEGRYRAKSREPSLSSRARALSLEFQANFQTIDASLHKIINKKQIFKSLYLRQKQKYEKILRKYNIFDEVDDHEFENYFKC